MRALANQGESLIAFNHPAGGHVMVTRDPSKAGRWRATRVDAAGEPLGHVEAENHHEAIKRAHDYGADIYSVQPLAKAPDQWLAKAMLPKDFRKIANATTREGEQYVDHKDQLNSHPPELNHLVEHYRNEIQAGPKMYRAKPGKIDNGITRKAIFHAQSQ